MPLGKNWHRGGKGVQDVKGKMGLKGVKSEKGGKGKKMAYKRQVHPCDLANPFFYVIF